MQAAQNPAVQLGTVLLRNLRGIGVQSVHVGVERKKSVGVVKGSEELALHLGDAVGVKLEVVPGLCVGQHVPAQGVAAVLRHRLKGVDGVAEALRHLLAVLVENQAVGDHIFIGY